MDNKFNLKWKTHQSHTKSLISELFVSQEFTDVTLVCDDANQLKAHKFMLSSSSTVFRSILQSDKEHPFIFLRGINAQDMQAILQFIYLGEATFHYDRMNEFLQVGKDLGIKELREYHAISGGEMQISSRGNYSNEVKSINNIFDINTESKSAYSHTDYMVQYNNKPSTKTESKNTSIVEFAERDQFACDICNKVYNSKGGLWDHKNSVHKGIKYACDECSYQATRQYQLGEHKKAKHGCTTYQCSTCNWTTKWKTHMNTHLKTHQQVQDMIEKPNDPLNK